MSIIPEYQIRPAHTLYDDDAVRAIGELFLDCATAEASILMILADLQAHPNPATLNSLATLTGMQNKVMLEKIGTTLAIIAPQHHAEFESICVKIRRIFEHRNALAHSTSIGGFGSKIVVVPFAFRPPIRLVIKTYDPAQLRSFGKRLNQLVRHLSERLIQIGVTQTKELSTPTFVDKEGPPFPVHRLPE